MVEKTVQEVLSLKDSEVEVMDASDIAGEIANADVAFLYLIGRLPAFGMHLYKPS